MGEASDSNIGQPRTNHPLLLLLISSSQDRPPNTRLTLQIKLSSQNRLLKTTKSGFISSSPASFMQGIMISGIRRSKVIGRFSVETNQSAVSSSTMPTLQSDLYTVVEVGVSIRGGGVDEKKMASQLSRPRRRVLYLLDKRVVGCQVESTKRKIGE